MRKNTNLPCSPHSYSCVALLVAFRLLVFCQSRSRSFLFLLLFAYKTNQSFRALFLPHDASPSPYTHTHTGARAEAPAGPPAATGGGPLRSPAPAPATPAPALAPPLALVLARGTPTREGSLARTTMSQRCECFACHVMVVASLSVCRLLQQ